MTTTENTTPAAAVVDPSTPLTKADARLQAREAKALKKANRNWFLRHKILTGVGAVAALAVAVNVGNAGSDDAPTASAPSAVTVEGKPAPEPAAEPAAETGTRSNPTPVGQPVTLSELGADTWNVTLSNPVLDATSAVAAANQFNEAAPEGMVYAMVTVDVTRLGEEAATPWVDLSVKFVSSDGTTHTSADTMAVEPSPSLTSLNEMYAGATGSGNVVIAIPAADAAAGTGNWTVSTMFGEPIFFAAK